MIRLAISVEGRTEEEFVKRVLASHLWERGVYPQPFLLGGNVTVEKLAGDMANHFWGFDRVTSLVDFYGFRDKNSATPSELEQRIFNKIDNKIGRSWDQSRVFPYVQQYEFEGLLFSNVRAFSHGMIVSEEKVTKLERIRSGFTTPEDINDNSETAPSKRIAKVIPGYRKAVYGSLIAEAAGLDTIRAECPRFNQWVACLESLDD